MFDIYNTSIDFGSPILNIDEFYVTIDNGTRMHMWARVSNGDGGVDLVDADPNIYDFDSEGAFNELVARDGGLNTIELVQGDIDSSYYVAYVDEKVLIYNDTETNGTTYLAAGDHTIKIERVTKKAVDYSEVKNTPCYFERKLGNALYNGTVAFDSYEPQE